MSDGDEKQKNNVNKGFGDLLDMLPSAIMEKNNSKNRSSKLEGNMHVYNFLEKEHERIKTLITFFHTKMKSQMENPQEDIIYVMEKNQNAKKRKMVIEKMAMKDSYLEKKMAFIFDNSMYSKK